MTSQTNYSEPQYAKSQDKAKAPFYHPNIERRLVPEVRAFIYISRFLFTELIDYRPKSFWRSTAMCRETSNRNTSTKSSVPLDRTVKYISELTVCSGTKPGIFAPILV